MSSLGLIRRWIRAVRATPHPLAMLQLQRGLQSQGGLMCLRAIVATGIASELQQPRTRDEIAVALGIDDPERLLEPLLQLAVAVGHLRKRSGRYSPKSALARAVVSESGKPIAAFLSEFTSYHADVFRNLGEQFDGEPPRDYLADYAGDVATASRIIEPFIQSFIEPIVAGIEAPRVLEVGCGSGVFLRHYVACNPHVSGVAIDVDANVVELARENLTRWEVGRAFEIRHENILAPGESINGPFDVITAFQNLYYFTSDERVSWFSRVNKLLAEGGVFAIASAFATEGGLGPYMAMVLGSTKGCHALPERELVLDELAHAGFESVVCSPLAPGPGGWGIEARHNA